MKSAYDVIIRPVITEQAMEDLDIKKYAFEVAKDRHQDRSRQKAVEEIFGVHRRQGDHHDRPRQAEARRPLPRRLCARPGRKAVVKLSARFQEH